MFGLFDKNDPFRDYSDSSFNGNLDSDTAASESATGDPHDFWSPKPRPIQRIVTRRTPSTPRARRNRSHGQTEQIKVIELDDTACRPFDGDTGLGGQSSAPESVAHRDFRGENNPLFRRVGAMMVLLSLGVPVAMALRGGDSGRQSLEAAALAAQGTGATSSVAVEGQTAGSVDGAVVTDAAGGSVAVTGAAATDAAPGETAAGLPGAQPAVLAAAPACVKTYEVVPDDGWLLIAAKHSITVEELLASNAASLSTFLLVGSTICVPANASAPTTDPPATPAVTQPAASAYVAPFSLPCAKTYTVVLGDGWLRIANKHSVAMKDVLAANAATTSTFLMVGRKICVPANATTPTVKTTTTTVKKAKPPRPPPEPTLHPPTRTYTPAEVEAIIREIWPDDLEEEALRIAKRESRLNPRAQNYCCWGLFQIYFNVHKKWLAEMGVTTGEQLLDPVVAAQAGLKLYQRNGWGPWKL